MTARDVREIADIFRSDAQQFKLGIVRNIGHFTVALFRIMGSTPRETLELAGTGTLVALNDRRFILTARHVWEEKLRTADRIGITMKENVNHRTAIDRQQVAPYGPAKPDEWSEWGPDIVLLSIPAEDLGRINAYRNFWDLAGRVEVNAKVMDVQVLMGTPAQLGTMSETFADVAINGEFLPEETCQTKGSFDYLDYSIDLSRPGHRDFGGVSGGGVWIVHLFWTKSETIDWKFSLHGVAFYQFPIVDEHRVIRCHGPKSIHAAIRGL
jgi:hypothetical protein